MIGYLPSGDRRGTSRSRFTPIRRSVLRLGTTGRRADRRGTTTEDSRFQAPVENFVPPGFAPAWEVYRRYTALDGGLFRTVSYLSAMNTEGEVISDDLTLVLQRPEGLVVAGGPFRGTYTRGTPLVGTFPVAGFYRLRKDARTSVAQDDGGCFADLLGNLPFVVDQLSAHSRLIDRLRSRVEGDRKSTRLNSSHTEQSRMPSSA